MTDDRSRQRKTVWALLSPSMRAGFIVISVVVPGLMALAFHQLTLWMCLNAVRHDDCTLPVDVFELMLALQIACALLMWFKLSRTTSSDPRLDALLSGKTDTFTPEP